MGELLGKAWRGFLEFQGKDKLLALFLLVILLVWLLDLGEKPHRRIWRYSTVLGILCICPVTAAMIMEYQTKFYDYPWIWALVPCTAMTACGGVLLLDRLWKDGTCTGWRRGVFLAGALAIVLLCGGNADPRWDVRDLREEREKAARALKAVSGGQAGICLWAPEEIMEHARSLDGGVTLVYGRNMWQEHLNAYSYDMYTQVQRDLYVWMTLAERTGLLDVEVEGSLKAVGEIPPEGTIMSGEKAMRDAMALGVNRILLPGNMEEAAITELAELMQCDAERVEGYYLFRLDEGRMSRR